MSIFRSRAWPTNTPKRVVRKRADRTPGQTQTLHISPFVETTHAGTAFERVVNHSRIPQSYHDPSEHPPTAVWPSRRPDDQLPARSNPSCRHSTSRPAIDCFSPVPAASVDPARDSAPCRPLVLFVVVATPLLANLVRNGIWRKPILCAMLLKVSTCSKIAAASLVSLP
jgi:hypothetical protein